MEVVLFYCLAGEGAQPLLVVVDLAWRLGLMDARLDDVSSLRDHLVSHRDCDTHPSLYPRSSPHSRLAGVSEAAQVDCTPKHKVRCWMVVFALQDSVGWQARAGKGPRIAVQVCNSLCDLEVGGRLAVH